jgi:hypothetical protein
MNIDQTRFQFFKTMIVVAMFPLLLLSVGVLTCEAKKFYDDDPIWTEPETQNASGVQEWEISLVYDLAQNLFTDPGEKTLNVRAQNINTIDEVPNSSWFTNRIGAKKLSAEEVGKGPDTTNGPAEGTWTIIAGKNDGVSPGFTIKDSAGTVWFIKPDPPGYPGMATGTEVAVTKLFWALGFNVAETHNAIMRLDNIQISDTAKVKVLSGKKRSMTEKDLKAMLRRAHKNEDGTYRVIASKALEGKPLGGFKLYGTRPDDPNDVVPHEHRRELRGYYVFAAWLNHVDIKALQSLDTLVSQDGKSIVRHHLLDFSSTLGSGSIYPHQYWEGYEHLIEKGGHVGKDMISFGFLVEPYRTARFYEDPTIGRIPADYKDWDPDTWMPRATNAAFRRADSDDKFWAARKVVAVTDDMIRAAINSGQFENPKAADLLVQALIDRRDAIGRRYLPAINPIVDPVLDATGNLTFANAAVDAGVAKAPQSYQVIWYNFDNETGQNTRIGGTTGSGTSMSAPSGLPGGSGAYVHAEISATGSESPSWQVPVHAYFHRTGSGWKLVGFERTPEEPSEKAAEKAKK